MAGVTYRCGRCDVEVPDPPDACSVCGGALCEPCWEAVGYCGPFVHPQPPWARASSTVH